MTASEGFLPAPHTDPAARSIAEVRQMASGELSLPGRLGHIALLLAALTMAVVTGALAATEPALPVRTRGSLMLMSGVGLSWVAYAIWVLTRRAPLLALHSLIAARMAVVYSGLFALAAGAAAVTLTMRGGGSESAAAVVSGAASGRLTLVLALLGTGVVMLAIAAALLQRARRRFRDLAARRATLERQIAAAGPAAGPATAVSAGPRAQQ